MSALRSGKRGGATAEQMATVRAARTHYAHSPLEALFWKHVDRRGEGECWMWTAAKLRFGYGAFTHRIERGKQKSEAAHRFSFRMAHGSIPSGMVVRHRCDNPGCVNPAHLENGHPLDGANLLVANRGASRRCRACTNARLRAARAKKNAVHVAPEYARAA